MCEVSLKDRKRSFVQSFGYSECGRDGEARWIEMV